MRSHEKHMESWVCFPPRSYPMTCWGKSREMLSFQSDKEALLYFLGHRMGNSFYWMHEYWNIYSDQFTGKWWLGGQPHVCPWWQIALITPTSQPRRIWNRGREPCYWDQANNMNGKPKPSHVLVSDSHHPLHPPCGPLLPLASNFNASVQILPLPGSLLVRECGTL